MIDQASQEIEGKPFMSRRAPCAGAAGMATNAAPARAADREDAELMRLSRELEAERAIEKAAHTAHAAGFDEQAYHAVLPILHAIEAAPAASFAGLVVKARALAWLHGGDIEEAPFSDDVDPTTDMRLAWQILHGVLALGRAASSLEAGQ